MRNPCDRRSSRMALRLTSAKGEPCDDVGNGISHRGYRTVRLGSRISAETYRMRNTGMHRQSQDHTQERQGENLGPPEDVATPFEPFAPGLSHAWIVHFPLICQIVLDPRTNITGRSAMAQTRRDGPKRTATSSGAPRFSPYRRLVVQHSIRIDAGKQFDQLSSNRTKADLFLG